MNAFDKLKLSRKQFYFFLCLVKLISFLCYLKLILFLRYLLLCYFFPLSDIIDLRHQSSAMCIIMLGEDTHPWSATKIMLFGNSPFLPLCISGLSAISP